MNHNELSIKITKSIPKEEKKNNGIYFTPKNIRTSMITKLKKYIDFNKTYDIVEPSCGSCEFIDDILLDKSIKCNIIGIEKNKKICSYPMMGYWLDIGSPADYEKAQKDIIQIKF